MAFKTITPNFTSTPPVDLSLKELLENGFNNLLFDRLNDPDYYRDIAKTIILHYEKKYGLPSLPIFCDIDISNGALNVNFLASDLRTMLLLQGDIKPCEYKYISQNATEYIPKNQNIRWFINEEGILGRENIAYSS